MRHPWRRMKRQQPSPTYFGLFWAPIYLLVGGKNRWAPMEKKKKERREWKRVLDVSVSDNCLGTTDQSGTESLCQNQSELRHKLLFFRVMTSVIAHALADNGQFDRKLLWLHFTHFLYSHLNGRHKSQSCLACSLFIFSFVNWFWMFNPSIFIP